MPGALPPAGAAAAVRRGQPGDAAAIAAALAGAFATDPVATHLFPDPSTRRAQLERFFGVQLRHSYLPRGEVLVSSASTTGRLVGASLWLPPSAFSGKVTFALWPILLIGVFGRRFGVARRLGALLERHHPAGPHYYLGTVGVAADRQRQGLGSALITPLLERCDAEGVPAYLESSRRDNVPFYARLGFAVRDEVTFEGGPTLWLMDRPPGGAA
ncbi:MAG: GNAT family N-acetyltransferase [Actinomycetota bacterium]|nr:GNAT family N-acetyltransferase [Actinomycetota bacterium]